MENDWGSVKQYNKDKRDKAVNKTKQFLLDNNIEFTKSSIPNIVTIDTGPEIIYLSLKKKSRYFKIRFAGSRQWHNYTKEKLKTYLNQP